MLPIWILFLLICLFWTTYLVRPLMREPEETQDRREQLVEEKVRYLFALRDAEMDFRTGKITEADFASVRDRLETKAAEVLKALDALEGGSPEAKVKEALERMRKRGT